MVRAVRCGEGEKVRRDNKVRSDEKEEKKKIQRKKGRKEKSLVSYPTGT